MNKFYYNCPNGQYSPLRYPGGKGKIARFMKSVIDLNSLGDCLYIEPFAGGAGIAWELLLTGIVRRVSINDFDGAIYAFWQSVFFQTEDLCKMIEETHINMDTWELQRRIILSNTEDNLALGFALFFLNRTNRSGIINGGIIGGKTQSGKWKIDDRFHKEKLINKITKISKYKKYVDITNIDIFDYLSENRKKWDDNTLIYMDPPYFNKGKTLYLNYFDETDHVNLSRLIKKCELSNCLVSYDDVQQIENLYDDWNWLRYSINYSTQNRVRGREIMFFGNNLLIPEVKAPLIELGRKNL